MRLKGGDPFVFGRGGEEALGLAAASVPFRVVPGITAGLGGLALADIPATTRETNRGVILLTGYSADSPLSSIDWAAIAATGLPLILSMGMTRLADTTAALIAAGASPALPAAVVMMASLPGQRVLVSDLAHVAEEAVAQGFGSPAIVAFGEMIRLRAAFRDHGLPALGEP